MQGELLPLRHLPQWLALIPSLSPSREQREQPVDRVGVLVHLNRMPQQRRVVQRDLADRRGVIRRPLGARSRRQVRRRCRRCGRCCRHRHRRCRSRLELLNTQRSPSSSVSSNSTCSPRWKEGPAPVASTHWSTALGCRRRCNRRGESGGRSLAQDCFSWLRGTRPALRGRSPECPGCRRFAHSRRRTPSRAVQVADGRHSSSASAVANAAPSRSSSSSGKASSTSGKSTRSSKRMWL